MVRGVVPGDRALAAAHAHVLGMGVRQDAERSGRERGGPIHGLHQGADLAGKGPGAPAHLHHDPTVRPDEPDGLCDCRGIAHGHRRERALPWQGLEVQLRDASRLRVEWQEQVERAGAEGTVDREGPPSECRPQTVGRVEHVGFAHQCRELAEEALGVLGDGLHVGAFAVRGLVPVDVIDADPVGGGGE